MKNKKGFTLIEMLVVVGIVGLLSSVILVALGPARNKGKNARIISDLKQIGDYAEATSKSLGNYNSLRDAGGNYVENINLLLKDIENQGQTPIFNLDTAGLRWAAYSPLFDASQEAPGRCIDSTGASSVKSPEADSKCPVS